MFVRIVNLGIFVQIVDVLFRMKMISILNRQSVNIIPIFVNGKVKKNIYLYPNGELKIQNGINVKKRKKLKSNPFPFYKQHDSMASSIFSHFHSNSSEKISLNDSKLVFSRVFWIFSSIRSAWFFVKNGSNSQKMIENGGWNIKFLVNKC